MKKVLLIVGYIFLIALFGLPNKGFSQGIFAPGGTGAWGNMVYGGIGAFTAPYSDKEDAVVAFGVGLGDPVNGFGFQIGSNMLDVSEQDAYNLGVKVHKYFGEGITVGVGLENILEFGERVGNTKGYFSSQYVAMTQDLRYKYYSGFLSRISYNLGVGFGRFSELTDQDKIEHDRENGTYVFGGLAYQATKRIKLHTDWSGVNLTAGVSLTSAIESIPFSIIVAATDLTDYTGDGARLIGAIGMVYQWGLKDANTGKEKINTEYQNNQDELLNKIDQLKNDLDAQIDVLEKEIELIKKKQSDADVYEDVNKASVDQTNSTDDANEKALNQKVKNYSTDEIVKVNDDGSIGDNAESGYYVVIHSFREKTRAQNAVTMEKDKGTTAKIVYNKNRKWYYVYSHMYKNLKEALVKSTEQREAGYEGAWVHIY